MNALEQWCYDTCMPTIEALNALQLAGIISDNCVSLSDVADADIPPAIEWLEEVQLT